MTKIVAAIYAVACVVFLIDGFRTGNMHFFGSLAFNGAAPRRGNPVWFWAYGAFNVLTAAASAFVIFA
jgi:hypothetical protein